MVGTRSALGPRELRGPGLTLGGVALRFPALVPRPTRLSGLPFQDAREACFHSVFAILPLVPDIWEFLCLMTRFMMW